MAYRSYTPAEYRAAGINAGPYALESNPNRNYRTSRRKPILGVVMHITVGRTDYDLPDTSVEGTVSAASGSGWSGSSWHVGTDSDGIIPCIRDSYVAWHAGVNASDWSHPAQPYINDATLGIEQGTSQVDWRKAPDAWVERTLRANAVWLAPRVKKYGIPLVVVRDRKVMGDAIMRGEPFGFISHATIAPHNRRDPGMVGNPPTWVDTYPWSQLFTMIREELAGTAPTSPEEDIVTPEQMKQILDAIAAVPGKVLSQPVKHPTLVDQTWGLKDAMWSTNVYALQAAMQVDADAVAAAVVAKLPADGLTAETVRAAVRDVFADAATPDA